MIRNVSALVVGLSIATMMVLPAAAHHSHAAYEPVALVAVEGVVSEVRWTNPHMWIVLDVPGKNGKVEKWGFEGSGTAMMTASGISPKILKIGNRVKIICHASRDPNKHEGLFMGLEVDGKMYARGAGTNIRGTKEEFDSERQK